MTQAQLTFVPSDLVPGAGTFALWTSSGGGARPEGPAGTATSEGATEALAAARALGLPDGEEDTLATVRREGDRLRPVDVDARLVPLLPAVRRLAVLPPGSDWPAWSRPTAAVLGWSVAAKLALELVAAGRLLPALRPADVPASGFAHWRIAAGGDDRLTALADALPVTAFALRRPSGELWLAEDLLVAFLDAVADACAREGRRPVLDARRRVPKQAWSSMWSAALQGVDPTVAHLRVDADELVEEIDEWAAPLLGRDRTATARAALRLVPPDVGDDGRDDVAARLSATDRPWRLAYRLQSTSDPEISVAAEEVWDRAGGGLELDGRRVEDPQATLARGLAAAARLFPPVDRSLSEVRPCGVELSATEVADLLATGTDALLAAGLGVQVPPEVQRAGEQRLRLRVRIGQSTPNAPRVEGAAPLGLQSLTDLTYEVALGEDALSPEEFAEIVALRQPLVRWRGTWVRVDHDEVDRLAELAGGSTSLELTEALAAALSGQTYVDDLGWVETVADGGVAELIEELRTADAPGEADLARVVGDLRPYQERGVAWLQRLTELGLGGVLADQMGLGKTVMAIGLLAARANDRPHLVVCPTSVVGNWTRELARFAPDVEVVKHHGPERAVSPRAFRPGAVVVTSYALLRRDVDLLDAQPWDVVVFDEAQQIKNPSSKGARAARGLEARTRIAMTGTPIENRLSELWAIVDVTNPGLLGSQRAFTERFAVPVERWHDQGAATRLRRLVAPFILRRLKSDPEVSVDLPPKQELTVPVTLTREQAAIYQAAIDDAFGGAGLGTTTFERRGRILALLTALKQICNHPAQYLRDARDPEVGRLAGRSGKLTRATEILGEIVDGDERALVFTQFREMGELLARHLSHELGLPEVPFLHGGVSLAARDAMVERFQSDDDAPPILLVSLRAGGTGLNLTRATHVMHYDRWWNPAVEDQATDRAHRIGQTRSVSVHTMVTAGTVEDRIAELLDRKRRLADAVVEAGESWLTELDDSQLRELVELSTADLGDDPDRDETDRDEAGRDQRPPSGPGGRPHLQALPGGRS